MRQYIENSQPLVEVEQEYIQHKHDLITLRPGRDHAWVVRQINQALQVLHKPFPFLNVNGNSALEPIYQNQNADTVAAHLLLLGMLLAQC